MLLLAQPLLRVEEDPVDGIWLMLLAPTGESAGTTEAVEILALNPGRAAAWIRRR